MSASACRPTGPAATLAVQRDGLIQAVDVPPGLGVITWTYTPPGFRAGLALSLVAAGLVCVFVVLALLPRRAGKPGGAARGAARRPAPDPG